MKHVGGLQRGSRLESNESPIALEPKIILLNKEVWEVGLKWFAGRYREGHRLGLLGPC